MPIPVRFFPFRRELEDLFQHDRAIWWKMVGSAFATNFLVFATTQMAIAKGEVKVEWTLPLAASVFALCTGVGVVLALILSFKDVVERRVSLGQPVNPILKLYFGLGVWSLIAWFPTVLVVSFFSIIAVAMLATQFK